MSAKHTLLKGTIILTLTGFATRFMGFFYRIFLSHTFGEEGVGLYQLVFPVYALCFSLTCAGIETALSRCVAKRISLGKENEARKFLYTSLVLSVSLSVLTTLVLQKYAVLIATDFLREARCADFLIILSYAFPFASVHSCIIGYYLGLKETKIPAYSQLIEQLVRIMSVWLLYLAGIKNGIRFGVSIAVAGLVAGEIASSFFCFRLVTRNLFLYKKTSKKRESLRSLSCYAKELLFLSAPLTANRILLNVLQSIEAVSIPLKLRQYGMTTYQALSVYGVLTGMALPCVLFPSAITNSVATMLLPAVTEAQTLGRHRQMRSIIKKSIFYGVLLGSACAAFFLLFGNFIGSCLFTSRLAGKFIITLAWTCPFLYTNTTLISIINGIGKTSLSFVINATGLMIRIMSVFFAIPVFGVEGYLYGLLLSQLWVFLLCMLYLSQYLKKLCAAALQN